MDSSSVFSPKIHCHYIVNYAPFRAGRGKHRASFTLVELLVSVAVFTLMLIILVKATGAVGTVWTHSTGQIEQFRNARNGFETITRRLSQATLNPYWDYTYNTGNGSSASAVPTGYMRQSDLRFISGPVQATGAAGVVPYSSTSCNVLNSHAIFFQAPLGVVSGASGLNVLSGLMNTCGYYLNFGSDYNYWPAFIQSASSNAGIAQRYRCRLMEMVEPSDQLTVYGVTSGPYGAAQLQFTSSRPSESSSQNWFTVPLSTSSNSRILAANIVALILLPHLATPATSGTTLTTTYKYDSTSYDPAWSSPVGPSTNSFNQLPPIVQVTMVAIDETSALRLAAANGTSAPNFGIGAANDAATGAPIFTIAANYSQDIATLKSILQGQVAGYGLPGHALNYRIFSSDISIAGAKWSTSY